MPTESSPEVSWLQTNSSKTTTPLKTTASSISITTPTNNPQQFPSHTKNLPDFSSTTHIKSNLLNKYDTKIHNLQSKIIHNEQNYNIDRQIFENAQKTLLANAELEIQRLKEDLSASSKKCDSIKSENKKFKTELVSLKSEMQLLGSDPVDDTVINDMKRRGNLTVRQVAEIRLHTILKPILLDLEGKNRQVEKLFEKCQGFEQLCEDNQVSVDSVTKMKSGYQEQLTRNRIELMDCRNQLTKYGLGFFIGNFIRIKNKIISLVKILLPIPLRNQLIQTPNLIQNILFNLINRFFRQIVQLLWLLWIIILRLGQLHKTPATRFLSFFIIVTRFVIFHVVSF